MQFEIALPLASGQNLQLSVDTGGIVFVVGANGTGKSSLMHRIYTAYPTVSRRIAAHRQTWFSSNALTLSPEQKRQTEGHMKAQDTNLHARWKDDYSAQRASISIYDLIDAENVRARAIASAVDGGDMGLAMERSLKDAPLKAINELLRLSNLPIEISVIQNEQVVARRRGSSPYSVAELSDGERNALLIAADVLTVPPGSLLLVDEPERHLHRSIISPLLTLLFAKRSDCTFIVSTHDIMLPIDNPSAKTLLIRDCIYHGNSILGWDADLLNGTEAIDESLKSDILGSRRRVLFIEGDSTSLDLPLYSLVFPNISVIPKASCRDVINAVTGIRNSASLHWVKAFGLIDNDRRAPADISRLETGGIYALSVFSVESVYYHPEIQLRVASRHSTVTGSDPVLLVARANDRAIASLLSQQERMCQKVVERAVRNEVERSMPTKKEVVAGGRFLIDIDVEERVRLEIHEFQEKASNRDVEALLARYPIKETSALAEIASSLGFQGRTQYESAVRKLLVDDAGTLEYVRGLFSSLSRDVQYA